MNVLIAIIFLSVSSVQASQTFSAGAEFYILKRSPANPDNGSSKLLLMPIQRSVDPACSDKTKSQNAKAIWLNVNDRSPVRLFENQNFEKVAQDTTDLSRAAYIKLLAEMKGLPDDSAFAEATAKKGWDAGFFGQIENHVPLSGASTPLAANDVDQVCPITPQRKNGKPCLLATAIDLPEMTKTLIGQAAKKHGVEPALVAAIIHAETGFDLFLENEEEKKVCANSEKACPNYRWGRSFAQLGSTDAALYGLDWNSFIAPPDECLKQKRASPTSARCLNAMIRICEKKTESLKPVNCPQHAIDAAAMKLARLIPKNHAVKVYRNGKLQEIDLSQGMTSTPELALRSQIGMYNRQARVPNSFAEHFMQKGRFPKDYSEAWNTDRSCTTPSRDIGFRILTKEFINRCYVWSIAGLCGEIPKQSLLGQYREVFGKFSANMTETSSADSPTEK